VMQYADEIPDAPYEIRVYCGADATFDLYEDAGDGYEYEDGSFSIVTLRWIEACKLFSLSSRAGLFPSLVRHRRYDVTVIDENFQQTKTLLYDGNLIQWKLSGQGE
jgi:alpha-D-xyloside xylohydrolase